MSISQLLPLDVDDQEQQQQPVMPGQGFWKSVSVKSVPSLVKIMEDEPTKSIQEENRIFFEQTMVERRVLFDLQEEVESLHTVWKAASEELDSLVDELNDLEEFLRDYRFDYYYYSGDDHADTRAKIAGLHPLVQKASTQEQSAHASLVDRVCAWERMTGIDTHFATYGHGQEWIERGLFGGALCRTCNTDAYECYCDEPDRQQCASRWDVRSVTAHEIFAEETARRQASWEENNAEQIQREKQAMNADEDRGQDQEEDLLFFRIYYDSFLIQADENECQGKGARRAKKKEARLHRRAIVTLRDVDRVA